MCDRFYFRAIYEGKVYDVWGVTPLIVTLMTGADEKDIKSVKTIDCQLLQCTGFKDKNGDLIYEGDDLLFIDDQLKKYDEVGYRLFKVVWQNGGWFLQGKDEVLSFGNVDLGDYEKC